MKETLNDFASSLADELDFEFTTARGIVEWLSLEGVLNFDVLSETYPKEVGPAVTYHLNEQHPLGVANDA